MTTLLAQKDGLSALDIVIDLRELKQEIAYSFL